MKLLSQILTLFFFMLMVISCNEKDDGRVYGTLVFKGVSEVPAQVGFLKSEHKIEKSPDANYIMHTTDLWVYIDEIWASQEMVADGLADDFKWYKIGEGDEIKSISEYFFTTDHLPVGDYKSLKFVFNNRIIRKTVYKSDFSKEVDMEGSLTEEDCGNNEKITQCFSKNGSFSLDKTFQLMSKGENIRGFKIKENEVTTVYWQLGSPGFHFTDCWFTWTDANNNQVYDCGVDGTSDFDCSKDGPMWTFGVDDGEEAEEAEANTFFPNAVTDIDGNSYNATQIGDQTWLAENLKTTQLNDGSALQTEQDYWQNCIKTGVFPTSEELPPPLYQYRNYQAEFIDIYGLTYNWKAVESGKLCPQGWHVPTLAEWNQLIDFLGENGGGKLKVVQFDPNYNWQPNIGATNETNFSALPGGGYIGPSTPTNLDFGNNIALFISSSNEGQALTPIVPFIVISGSSSEITIARASYDSFFSCRCLKDK
ncbi:MAG: fibrobacter succinogenes major paralogous domain-containing protein [Prolixibacteraceae bacterium]